MNAQRDEEIKRLQFWIDNAAKRVAVSADQTRIACDLVHSGTMTAEGGFVAIKAANTFARELESYLGLVQQRDTLKAGDA